MCARRSGNILFYLFFFLLTTLLVQKIQNLIKRTFLFCVSIVAFTFYTDTKDVLSLAGSLMGTCRSINRDYPMEITNARRTLWPQFKSARANPAKRVCMGFPAKLIVNGAVVCDLFPDWDRIMKGSRIAIDQRDQQNNPVGALGSTIPTTNGSSMKTGSSPRNHVEFMDT